MAEMWSVGGHTFENVLSGAVRTLNYALQRIIEMLVVSDR